jgi:hypothetical protein
LKFGFFDSCFCRARFSSKIYLMSESGKQEKPSLAGLTRSLGQLPADKKRAALEISAALAGVSLRVSREFIEAVPAAAEVLSADDLRQWGELGRRLAMGSAEIGAKFFGEGVKAFQAVPEPARSTALQICCRQLVLSSSVALGTFHLVPVIARDVENKELLSNILALALEIAQRSAKHSADFLEHTPAMIKALERFGEAEQGVADEVLSLALSFANRTGGMTADLWQSLPAALEPISAEDAEILMQRAREFLDFGGSVTLHFIASGSKVLQTARDSFEDWTRLCRAIAAHGNAVLISFIRATPKFFTQFASKGDT